MVTEASPLPRSWRRGDRQRRGRASPHPTCLSSAAARQGLADGDEAILARLFPPERTAPIVTVMDGHPHTLAFLAAIAGAPIANLGVQDFGQSGDVQDLYQHFGIDAERSSAPPSTW